MKLYRWLLKLYPARYREEYQAEMERQFRDEYRDAPSFIARFRLWLRALADLGTSIPPELAREISRDLKYSLRVYRRRSLSAIFAVAALALAIGTSTAVFSVLNALLFRSLPFSHPDQLVEIMRTNVGPLQGRDGFNESRQRLAFFQDLAAFSSADTNVSGQHEAVRVKVAETTANFFELLGTKATAGR